MLKKLGEPEPLRHPVAELLAIGAEARAWLGVLRSRLAQLATFETGTTDGAERERATVVLYERALERTAKILTDLARLDLDTSLVRVERIQAELMSRAFLAAIDRASLPEEWRPAMRMALANELRALPA